MLVDPQYPRFASSVYRTQPNSLQVLCLNPASVYCLPRISSPTFSHQFVDAIPTWPGTYDTIELYKAYDQSRGTRLTKASPLRGRGLNSALLFRFRPFHSTMQSVIRLPLCPITVLLSISRVRESRRRPQTDVDV